MHHTGRDDILGQDAEVQLWLGHHRETHPTQENYKVHQAFPGDDHNLARASVHNLEEGDRGTEPFRDLGERMASTGRGR